MGVELLNIGNGHSFIMPYRQLEKCTAPLSDVWSLGSGYLEPAEDMILINQNKIWWLPSPDLIFSSAPHLPPHFLDQRNTASCLLSSVLI